MNLESLVCKVSAEPLNKKIEVPSSKSYANRAIILGALRGNNFQVQNISASTDVQNLLRCLEQLGLKISKSDKTITFENSFPACEKKSDKPILLKTGDGGTTNRFLMALLSLGQNEYHLLPSEQMATRPMEELVEALKILGAKIKTSNDSWLSIQGPIVSSTEVVEVDCSRSTQFATAMKLISTVVELNLKFVNSHSSLDYLKMTNFVIDSIKTKNHFSIPVDFSSLSYPAVLAALSGEITFTNCFEIDELQPDSQLISILKRIGCHVEFTTNGLVVSQNKDYQGFEVDGSQCPDLIMSLVVLASKINSPCTLRNLEVLKYKESDRLSGIINILDDFGIKYEYDSKIHQLIILGNDKIMPNLSIFPARDHRMVMMAYLLLRLNSGGMLYNAECVEKSFPNFFSIIF